MGKEEVRKVKTTAAPFEGLKSNWSALGLKSQKIQSPKPKLYKCVNCTASFHLLCRLQSHRRHVHQYVHKKVAPISIKKRDPQKHRRQLKEASKKKRQRIPRSQWPS